MKRGISLVVFVLFLGVIPIHAQNDADHSGTHQIPCPHDADLQLRSAAEILALNQYPRATGDDVQTMASIGIRCESNEGKAEFMAEVAIRVDIGRGGWAHGLFHMHFTETGNLIPTPGSSPTYWYENEDPNSWKVEWCHHLRNSLTEYKKELLKYSCN